MSSGKGNACSVQDVVLDGRAGQQVKALVVDDEATNRIILSTILEKQGYHVILAENGQEAVEKFRAEAPDLVLMDVCMPVMDGHAATRIIKASSGERFVPVILVTATHDDAALSDGIAAGGDDFISKPYSRVVLLSKIQAQLRTLHLYETLRRQKQELELLDYQRSQEYQFAERIINRVSRPERLVLNNLSYVLWPMDVLNGDFILAAQNPSGAQLFMVGDFTGHGLPAAIGGMVVYDVFYSMAAKGFSITDIVPELNHKLTQLLPPGRFLSACLIELDGEHHSVSVWNGGMPDIYIRGDEATINAVFPSSHLPLGILPNEDFEATVSVVEVSTGDRIFAYSDGLIETMNEAGEMFGQERLKACFLEIQGGRSPFGHIVQSVLAFRGHSPQRDDVSLIEISCDGVVTHSTQEAPIKAHAKPPMDWSFSVRLGPESLRNADPLPLILQFVTDMQGLQGHRERLYLVLQELFANALDHGILGLDSALKRSPDGFADYYLKRKSSLAQLTDASITVSCEHTPDPARNRLTIGIHQSGTGFDFKRQLLALDENTGFSGRGISLVKTLCDTLEYEDEGRCARAVYGWEYSAPVEQRGSRAEDDGVELF